MTIHLQRRHSEERSDEAIHRSPARTDGLLRLRLAIDEQGVRSRANTRDPWKAPVAASKPHLTRPLRPGGAERGIVDMGDWSIRRVRERAPSPPSGAERVGVRWGRSR